MGWVVLFTIFVLILTQIFAVPLKSSNNCGYDSCNLGQPGKLNVHIVAHTHDDVGWLKTVDQYYYGSRREISSKAVQYILDSVIEALVDNPDQKVRNIVKQLVNESRLEFISGGWCMNDEATTHYNSIIDQHSLGAEFLQETFGECARPKIAWQIDPFGHSREVGSLFAQMGFDGMFLGRADYQDQIHRGFEKKLEMIWKASANLDRQSWLFAGILPYGYGSPFTFCYDSQCSDPPIMDDKNLKDYNVPGRVLAFIAEAYALSKIYATNHLIMTMGGDFQDKNAHEKFKNLDKLIHYVNLEQNNGSDINVFYSTPSCYLYALNKAGKTWTTKRDDFFPYAMVPASYWTGYYTSRPALKFYERYANNILQVTRQLNGFAQTNSRETIFVLSEALGLAQHHDAVSGTEKQHVANDYAQRLADGIDRVMNVINNAYERLLPKNNRTASTSQQFLCSYLNISACLPIEGQDHFTLTLWNPTIHPIIVYPRVPVTRQYSIRDPRGNLVVAEYFRIPETIQNLPGRMSSAQNQYLFQVSLPALGFNTYYFEAKTQNTKNDERMEHEKVKTTVNEACVLQNEHLRVEFNSLGELKEITNLDKNLVVAFSEQGFYWYASYTGNKTAPVIPSSGAYIFHPLLPEPAPVSLIRRINCTKASTVQKASIIFNDWISEEFNLYNGSSSLEVEWIVGPIPIDDNIGKEIIVRYNTNIKSTKKYYTDANGREVLERIRDYRPTWHHIVDEPISSNYYPINSRIWIKDDDRQFTILTDRSEGGGSMWDGSVEIMIHRRILQDDSMGVGEALNETAYGKGLAITGKHILSVDRPSDSARFHRTIAQQFYMRPLATFSVPNTTTYTNYSNIYRQTWSALSDSMPMNVHLLTFDQLNPKQYLVRVEHYFELNEDEIYSKAVTIDIQTLFQSIGTISDMVELILTANLPVSDLHRLEWMTDDQQSSKVHVSQQYLSNVTTITLNPMQIRTFQITIA
ncbi:unnamed protein product [Adineta ricciae]|uniref:Alpha-mannosidase n=1 Tax=Adineta ricciae TaxID=249248 RepID=A0A815HUA7_ADIRI|nr:unnamed protein product [Adineta ricciae]